MNFHLERLDRWLAQHGEKIHLRRTVGTGNQSYVQCEIKAQIKPLTEQQLVGGISQQSFLIITSPTEIIKAQWPGGKPEPLQGNIISPVDQRLPAKNDVLFIRGEQRIVTRSSPVFYNGECSRIELTVLG